jgi:hypothetical protein
MTAIIPIDETLAALVTVIRAARLTGDEATERVAQRRLWDRYALRVAFDRAPPPQRRSRRPAPAKKGGPTDAA